MAALNDEWLKLSKQTLSRLQLLTAPYFQRLSANKEMLERLIKTPRKFSTQGRLRSTNYKKNSLILCKTWLSCLCLGSATEGNLPTYLQWEPGRLLRPQPPPPQPVAVHPLPYIIIVSLHSVDPSFILYSQRHFLITRTLNHWSHEFLMISAIIRVEIS